MAKTLAFLEYTFIFEPGSETWTRGLEFEKDLTDFLAAHGLVGEIIETIGGTGRRVIFIEKMDKFDELRGQANPPGRPKSVSSQLKEMSASKPRAAERNFNKGKFLIRKGYLKREV